jgi:hypothetical protein
MFFPERQEKHVPLGHWRNDGLSKLLYLDQTGDNQKKAEQDYTVLKICDVCLPLVQLQLIKIVSLHAALPCLHKECAAVMLTVLLRPYNWPIKVESISQSGREFMLPPLPPARKPISGVNTSFKLIQCRIFLTYRRKYYTYIWHQRQQFYLLGNERHAVIFNVTSS